MFLLASKLLDIVFAPLAWGIVLMASGFALLFVSSSRKRGARLLFGCGLLLVLLFSVEPVAILLGRLVERPPADTIDSRVVYDAIAVLGGYVDPEGTAMHGHLELADSADRLTAGVELLGQGRGKTLVFSGGNVWGEGTPEAELASRWAIAVGLPPGRIVAESKSRNTRENATEFARLARERGWKRVLLVTSARHMRRSLECFRAAGLSPDTLAVDHRSRPLRFRWLGLLPRAEWLADSTSSIRELAGIAIYRATR
jgi:uncharacterized SAM-binding protein YcdF (DUF218 family)